MTLEEASKRFGVDLDKLKNYEKNGLLTPIETIYGRGSEKNRRYRFFVKSRFGL